MKRSDFLRLIPGLGAAVAVPAVVSAETDEVPITDPELRRQLLGMRRYRHMGSLELDDLGPIFRFYKRRNPEACGEAYERIEGLQAPIFGGPDCPATFTYEWREKETESGILYPEGRWCLCGRAEWPEPIEERPLPARDERTGKFRRSIVVP